MAKWVLDDSNADPEVTRWDDEESAAQKLAAKAATAADRAVRTSPHR